MLLDRGPLPPRSRPDTPRVEAGLRGRHVCTRVQHTRPNEVPIHRPAGRGEYEGARGGSGELDPTVPSGPLTERDASDDPASTLCASHGSGSSPGGQARRSSLFQQGEPRHSRRCIQPHTSPPPASAARTRPAGRAGRRCCRRWLRRAEHSAPLPACPGACRESVS